MAEHTENSIEIDAPASVVYTVINDLARWPELFELEYQSVEVIEQAGNRVTFRLTTHPDPNGRCYSWISERCLDPKTMTVTARRIELGPFKYMHIFQSVTPLPGDRSLLRWVQDFELQKSAPLTDAQMRDRINAGSAQNLQTHRQVIEASKGPEKGAVRVDARGSNNVRKAF